MCGIAGVLLFEKSCSIVTAAYLEKMRDTMIHRGPDDAGIWVSPDQHVGFAHRRLSIIDLSAAAAQPMYNDDESLCLIFNGEIYNHQEIRKQLEGRGHRHWKTDHSDTEVILHAFQEWGIDCVQHFRGMFSFAIWDTRQSKLWLVRDRMGIKPLYYSIHHDKIIFASEIKALLTDPGQQRQVNEEALYHYLSFLTAPAPQTFFDGIKKLPAGSWMSITARQQSYQRRYWDVWDHTKPLTQLSDHEISELVLEELKESVRLRKISDVPVGIFLSGGIDSSTNASLFSEGENQAVKTFSIGYHGKYRTYQNELQYARLMAEHIGADHYERLLTADDLIEFLPHMVYLQDEPIADPVCVPVYYLSKLAREQGVTVCQVGEGADELFWGYPYWKTMLALQHYNNFPMPVFLKKCGLSMLRYFGKEKSFPY